MIKLFRLILSPRFWRIFIERKLYWAAYEMDKNRPCAICKPWISYGEMEWCCHPYARHNYKSWPMTEQEIARIKQRDSDRLELLKKFGAVEPSDTKIPVKPISPETFIF